MVNQEQTLQVLKRLGLLCTLLLLLGWGATAHAAVDSANLLDGLLQRYQSAASGWAAVMTAAASRLFWSLVLLSMVWTFGQMALRKADMGEFFAELVRFTLFTGFFWWLLLHGPEFAVSIMDSLRQLGAQASGLDSGLSPSGILDVGFAVLDQVLQQSSLWDPVSSGAGLLMGLVILVILSLVAVNMLLLLLSGWILAYGGIFFLGFGGARWTSELAIHYYKTILGLGAQLMTMVLVVGIGRSFLDDYYNHMSANMPLREIAVLLVVCVILLLLVNKLPGLMASLVAGHGAQHSGIGQFGAASAASAVGLASAAMHSGTAALGSGLTSAAGAAQALQAAYSQAREQVANGEDVLSLWGSMGNTEQEAPNSTPSSTGGSDYAQAAGLGTDNGHAADTPQGSPSENPAHGQTEVGWRQAGKVALGTVANLLGGGHEVLQQHWQQAREELTEQIADTLGGQIAAAIQPNTSEDLADEVAAFAKDDAKPGS